MNLQNEGSISTINQNKQVNNNMPSIQTGYSEKIKKDKVKQTIENIIKINDKN